MSSPARDYTDEIHKALRYWATWLPGTKLELGSTGSIRDRVFSPESSLRNLGLDPAVTTAAPATDLNHVSSNAVSHRVQVSAANQVIPGVPQGTAGMEVTFSRKHAIVLMLDGARERRIDDIPGLGRELAERVEDGSFPREHAVITHLVTAESAAVLISSGADATYTVTAEVDLTAGLLDLATLGATLSRVASTKMQTEIVAAHKLTPLFKLAGFKRRGLPWARPRMGGLQFEDDEDAGQLGELDPHELDADE